MDYDDIDKMLSMIYEQNPEGFRSWLDSNYCLNCQNNNRDGEPIE